MPPAASDGPLLVHSPVEQILRSTRNVFGLFRQYRATRFPEHDPDENTTSDDLMETSPDSLTSYLSDSYHPYPNQFSFLLGEWYWNDGLKKSRSSFKNLLKIIGHPDYQPQDVAATNWHRIDAQLGGDVQQDRSKGEAGEDDWEDEEPAVEGDWTETPIEIKVPFHKRTKHPGHEQFWVGMLRHRNLVSVIREKIS
jgi:hypothetical protein